MGTTTIKSTALDFQSIKSNLKTFLAQQDEFSDYNFEASGLSNILDVLAYNTHYNGLIANFALNESYLGSAQLRSSIVSLAEGIGYVPDSMNSSQGVINMSISLAGVSGRPNKVTIPSGFKFNSTVDDIAYVFQTQEEISATDDGAGAYKFTTVDGSENIKVFEGTATTKTFLITGQTENFAYIIPDENMDIDTAVVKNFETASGTTFSTFTDLRNATSLTELSRIYILKESPNGNFELSFGNKTTLGISPVAGNKVTVDYLSVKGADANGAKVFAPQQQVQVNGVGYTVSVSTVSNSSGGAPKETVESIRTTAPFQYATQNRAVTADDYATLTKRNFSSLIKDIKAFGGQDALEPEFGVVFLSLLFNDTIENDTVSGDATKQETKDAIVDLLKDLSVASFDIKFIDPVKTFLETTTFFQFNPNLTSESEASIKTNIDNEISSYFSTKTGKFGQSFRRSNLLALIDEVSPAVLSSRMNLKVQQRFTPTLTAVENHSLKFPMDIAVADDVNRIVTSSAFNFNNQSCSIRNRLGSTILELFSNLTQEVIVDNVGSFSGDTVSITGLQVDSIVTGDTFVKVSVVPANQSFVTPLRENVIEFDAIQSSVTAVEVDSSVIN